ncbi:hypothetical protein AM2_2479 [Lactococcus cremoris]|nr:hypothetical protein LMG6897_1969 [Lactococcus cremoris]KZK44413.1 hypothetical protein SK110_2467 [Lactococcus cremoris]KZK48115.1 hypothetical protein B40_0178 [Lactococcus cremoris]KZK51100.1 hypothetical protein AM2_2479 [Lactococcus cremoris]KZK51424.1 hypothetical protein FG2_0188 [Lactococcus cremoris]
MIEISCNIKFPFSKIINKAVSTPTALTCPFGHLYHYIFY